MTGEQTGEQFLANRPESLDLAGLCKSLDLTRCSTPERVFIPQRTREYCHVSLEDRPALCGYPWCALLAVPARGGAIKSLDLKEAAAFLRCHPQELRQRAKTGKIPGAKVGRAWVFLENDLAAYIRSRYVVSRQALQVTLRKESECHYANAAVSGGSTSLRPMGNEQLGKHATHVFSYQGSRITQVSTKAWYAALERAGIEDFRWHDLRHTWASWHVQGGTPLYVLQEMGGWASAEMVRRYAHLAADHLAPYAERLEGLREKRDGVTGQSFEIHGTNPSQGVESQEKSA